MSEAAMRRSGTGAIILSLLLAARPAASEGADCAVLGSPSYFTSGGFYSGDTLIGNAFVIMASAGSLCGERGDALAPICRPGGAPTRRWVTQMVTAAHVVRALCENAPDPAEKRARDWVAASLILYPRYKLERLHSHVSVNIDAQWCKDNLAYKSQIPGTEDNADSHSTVADNFELEHSDIWTFTALFELPKRALITPYGVDLPPKRGVGQDATFWGFSPKPYEDFIEDSVANKPITFGQASAKLRL